MITDDKYSYELVFESFFTLYNEYKEKIMFEEEKKDI